MGIPAALCTGLCEVANRVGASRVVQAGRFHHPFGDPERSPENESAWRQLLVRRALDSLTKAVESPVAVANE